jgi:DNA-binding beta-propeller fold protein YncE
MGRGAFGTIAGALLALGAAAAQGQELTFLEAEIVPEPPPSACTSVSLGDVVVSPDGAHLYATYDVCIGDDQIAIYARAADGTLTFQAFHPADANPSGLAMAPDGLALFSISNNGAAQAMRREPATGALSFADLEYDGQGGVTHTLYARDAAVSPDGRHLYVVGQENAITTFAWDDAAGTLTLADVDVHGEGELVLDNPEHVAVGPTGDFVFVATSTSDTLAVFLRDPVSGALGYLTRFVDGVEGVTSLDAPAGLAVAPTEPAGTASVYVASFGTGSAARFLQGFPNESPAVAFADATSLFTWPAGLLVPPAGDRLFVTDVLENRVAAIERDPATGALGTEVGAVAKEDLAGDVLTQPRRLAGSADGSSLYATGIDRAIVVLHVPVPEPGGTALGLAAALALLLTAGIAPRARAATIVVETTGDPAPAGLCGLRDAIAAANGDAPAGDCPAGSGADVIDLTGLEGEIHVGSSAPPAELPWLMGDVEIRGPGADRLAVSGDGTVRVFLAQGIGSGAVIEGLTIRDGDSSTSWEPGLGGCVYALGPLALRDARLTNCAASALYVGMGSSRLARVLVDSNPGAGIRVGGVGGGGAIVLENSTVSGNALGGLALVNADGPGPSAWVYHSTFVDNAGWNVFVPVFSGEPGEFPLHLDHVLLASGEPNVNCGGQPVISLGHNLANDDSCALDATGDLPATPAAIGPLADNGGPTATHAPFPYGDAVDTGATGACPGRDGELATDQRGAPRPRDGDGDGQARCDRGAVEVPEPGAAAGVAALAVAVLAGASRRRAAPLGTATRSRDT